MKLSLPCGAMSNNVPEPKPGLEPWYKRYGILAAVIAISAAIIGAYAAFQLGYIAKAEPHDFSFTANPPIGEVQQGGTITVTLKIENAQNYQFPVSINITEQPQGMQVSISPPRPQIPPYDAIVSINVASEVNEGSYNIKFIAEGSDEKRHILTYPLTVKIPPSPPPPPVKGFTPVSVFDAYYPSGVMGDWGDISLNDAWTEDCHTPPVCMKISYSGAQSQRFGWAGVYWQYPDKNWGDNPDGRDLTGATKLTFWAKGSSGGEKAEFKVGGITGRYPDSIQPAKSTGVVVLSSAWQKYTVDLRDRNLHHVIGGFEFGTNKNQNPSGSTIYLDDIQFEA